jgi:superfamily I DNA and/or RNA helicase
MNNSLEYLQHIQKILKIEADADYLLYKQKMLNTSINYQKKEGLCWYPVFIREERIGLGGMLYVEIEKFSDAGLPHAFQTGGMANLFAAHHEKEIQSVQAVIAKIYGDRMTLVFSDDELPDWIYEGKLGVNVGFDDSTYKDMNFALEKLMNTQHPRTIELREIILGFQKPTFNEEIPDFFSPKLNESQNNALTNVLAANDVAVIHGPPGTGKTTTLTAAVIETLKTEKQVLVCAPSNTAVDLISEKLAAQGVKVTRLGHPARVNEQIISLTLESKFSEHHDYRMYKNLLKKAEALRQSAGKFKRTFGHKEREQRREMYIEAKRMKQDAAVLEDFMMINIFDKTQVFATTLTGAGAQSIQNKRFKTVFIDEAAQALEPATWIPIMKASRVVFAGDHRQLPPTVKSTEAASQGLAETLLEKVVRIHKADVMLQTQYRMNEVIMNFSNKKFYNGNLKADESVRTHRLFPEEEPFELIDTAGSGYFEQIEDETLSRFNTEEANLLFRHLRKLLERSLWADGEKTASFSIGIISPYKAQVAKLREMLREDAFFANFNENIQIHTVDGFQGQERDIIYISLVRSNNDSEIGFLADTRRMNVALTRARKKLVVVCDSATLGGNAFYADLFQYAEKNQAYHTAWEFLP